jgi:hypothetical protein
MNGVEIFEQPLCKDGREVGKVAFLRGGLNTDNPMGIMKEAVSEYVNTKGYNEFIEIHMDNPWVRVIVSGINKVNYERFEKQRL